MHLDHKVSGFVVFLLYYICLNVFRCCISSDASVLKALLDFVLQTLANFHLDVTKMNADFETTANSLWDFATEFLQSSASPQDVKNAALSILLALALRTGAVNRITQVIQHLLQENVSVDPQIYGLIHTICDILPNFNLYPPPNKVSQSDKLYISFISF